MARNATQRKEQQQAFVLHSYPYRETSLLIEAFTPAWGRVALLARGARRPRSELRGVLRAFQPLRLSWNGSGEVKTLMKAEWQGGMVPPARPVLMSAFYLNELLLRFLPREDAHPALFEHYETTLRSLSETGEPLAQGALLRRFELTLLTELGYAMHLTHEAGSPPEHRRGGGDIADHGADAEAALRPVVAGRLYHYVFEEGPRACAGNGSDRDDDSLGPAVPRVRGATLQALARQEYPDGETAAEARRLMARVLDHFLEHRRLASRDIARELARFKDRYRN